MSVSTWSPFPARPSRELTRLQLFPASRTNHPREPIHRSALLYRPRCRDPASSLVSRQSLCRFTVIPFAGITFGGAGAGRNVNVTAGAQNWFFGITVRVIDTGGKSNSTAFIVTVLPTNTSPLISAIAATNTLSMSPTGPILSQSAISKLPLRA